MRKCPLLQYLAHFIFILFSYSKAAAQCEESFQTIWGLNNGNSILVTHAAYNSQQDLLVCGTSASKGIIVHYNKTNSIKWAKTFAVGNMVSFKRVVAMDDGGVVAVGSLTENNVYSLIVVRLNASGNLVWTKRLHDIANAPGLSLLYLLTEGLAETPDGGVAVCGRKYYKRNSDGQFNYRMFLFKLSANGGVDWTREDTYGNDDGSYSLLIDQGSILMVGDTYIPSIGTRFGFFEKLNPANGNVQLLKLYQLSNLESNYFRSIEKRGNGYEIGTQSSKAGTSVYTDLKINADGDETACKKLPVFGPSGFIDQYYYPVPLPDGSSVLWKDGLHTATEAQLAKIGSGANDSWQYEYTLPGIQKMARVLPAGDGAIAIGQSPNPQTPNNPDQIHLIKVKVDGLMSGCASAPLPWEYKDSLHFVIRGGNWQTYSLNFEAPYDVSPVVQDVGLTSVSLCRGTACHINGIDIEGDKLICEAGTSKTYKAKISATCAMPAKWTLDAPIGTLQQLNDSMVRVDFTMSGTAMLRATVGNACESNFNQVFLTYRPEAGRLYLGVDTAICKGDTLKLALDRNYTSIEWSNGEKGMAINVQTTGAYSVSVSNSGQCFIKDTIQVQVNARPAVQLPKENALCLPEVKLLNAGAGFAQYIWHDGSTQPTYEVNQTGTYWVKVTDQNGCKASDTVIISKIGLRPTGFIPFADTSICMGENLHLHTLHSYQRYSWNNGASDNAVYAINRPGSYQVQVWDGDGCTATEIIVVRDKGCVQAVYVPSAFTPDGDEKNDQFKATVIGSVEMFELMVFNRWGELVYKTTDAKKGWNGYVGKLQQSTGVYVWMVRYRFWGSSTTQQQKGTVTLIR